MIRTITGAVTLCLGLCACSLQPGTTPFYEGRTVRLVVNKPPGGAYDADARLLARHLGRHLEGQPQVLVENMAGAGGLAAPVFLATRAPRDGLTLGFFGPDFILAHLDDSERPQIGLDDLVLLGSPVAADRVCVFSKRSGISDLASWKRASVPPRLAGTARGGLTHLTALVLKEALGLPIQVVQGYAGSAEVRLAVESGEVDGTCAGWGSFELFWREGAEVVPVLRATSDPLPGMEHVPDAMSVAESAEARELIRVGILDMATISRFIAAPAGVPAERLAIIERALRDAYDDPELRREATRSGGRVAPISRAELGAAVDRLLAPGPGRELLARVLAPQ